MKGKSKKSKNQKAAQESNAATASSEATTTEEYAPVDGSWIAELDDAKDELKGVLKMPGGVDKHRVLRKLDPSWAAPVPLSDFRSFLVFPSDMFQDMVTECLHHLTFLT
jgi:hypothetical protein